MLNEQLIMAAMTGDSTSEHCLMSQVGAGSSSHCLHNARRRDAATSLAMTAVPKLSSGETSRASTVGGTAAAVDARMAAIFPSKKRCELCGRKWTDDCA